jgi:hypothetical protein
MHYWRDTSIGKRQLGVAKFWDLFTFDFTIDGITERLHVSGPSDKILLQL